MALDERLADVPHHLTPRGLGLRVEPESLEQRQDDPLVVLGLLEILLPLLLQLVVLDAAERRLVHLDAALLSLERLIEELVDLLHLQGLGHGRYLVSDLVIAERVSLYGTVHAAGASTVPFEARAPRAVVSLVDSGAFGSRPPLSRPQDPTAWQVMCKASTTRKDETFSGTPWPSPVILTCERHAGQRKPLAGRACGTRSGGRGRPSVGCPNHPAPGRIFRPSGRLQAVLPRVQVGSSTGLPRCRQSPPWRSSLPRFFPPPAQRPESGTIAGRRRARSSCGG